MLPFYSKFIGGINKQQLLNTIRFHVASHDFIPIIDLAREHSQTKLDVLSYTHQLKDTIMYLNDNNVQFACALKLSSFKSFKPFHMMYDMIDFMLKHEVQDIFLDAESDSEIHNEAKIYPLLLRDFQHIKLFKTYQMYRLDSFDNLVGDIDSYQNLNIKLVRGAYMHQDKPLGVLHGNKRDTDANYNKAIAHVHEQIQKNQRNLSLLVASHNNSSCDYAMNIFKEKKDQVAFAQLLGMNNKLSKECRARGFTTYKYVPFGSLQETLPYLSRRIYENYDILKYVSF
jgi:hypothetical protein